jgi:transposase
LRSTSITKTGSKHARRILVQAAWNYRFKAQLTRILEVREQGQPKSFRDIAWRAPAAPRQALQKLERRPSFAAKQGLHRRRL